MSNKANSTLPLSSYPIEKLRTNPLNPRGPVTEVEVQGLRESIEVDGIQQPLKILPNGTIVIGHRRFLAAKLAGLIRVPCIIESMSEDRQIQIMLVENMQRKSLSPLQEARGFKAMSDRAGDIDMSEIARRTGILPSIVRERMIILKLIPDVQSLYDSFDMPLTAISPLSKVSDPGHQRRFAMMVQNRKLTVPRLKVIVENQMIATGKGKSNTPRQVSTEPLFTRKDALNAIEKAITSEQSITYAQLYDSIDGVCRKCGLENSPEVCNACPLPQFIRQFTALTAAGAK